MNIKFAALGLLLFSQITFAAESLIDVTVNVKNIEKDEGTLMIALIDDSNDFPDGIKATFKAKVPAKAAGSSYVFKGVKPGKYGVAIYQDMNANEKLDKNFVGIPKEPYGFSGKPGFGKPKFEDCSLEMTATKTVEVNMKN